MPIFKINSVAYLGISHYGSELTEGEGEVTLTDEEVKLLVDLIRENDGETDVEELGLEEKYPELYEKLRSAYYDAAWEAARDYWIIDGYENGYYDEPDDLMDRCEEYGFSFEMEEKEVEEEEENCDEDEDFEDDYEDAKREAFEQWIAEYQNTHSDHEFAEFLLDIFDPDINYDGIDCDYEVQIPEEIVKMAEG